nr:hypothetical protein [Haloferax profundi]
MLIFALIVISTTILLAIGAPGLTATQEHIQMENAEVSLTKLDSDMAVVAMGPSNVRQVDLGRGPSKQYLLDDDAGSITVSFENDSGTTTIVNTTMGSITYEGLNGETIAYQGGGVWRAGANGGSTMVSPPEVHYRGATLTLPLVVVNGDNSIDRRATITSNGSTRHFPNSSLRNPLEGGAVTIEIRSEYHMAWRHYFEERTEGAVEYYPDDERVEVTLTVPVTETFDKSVSTTSDGPSAIENEEAFETNETGVSAPAPDFRIESEIDDCATGNCSDLSSEAADDTLEAGRYYENGDVTLDDTTYDTSGGDIDIVVNGSLEFSHGGGGPGIENHHITGDGNVTFYVNGDVEIDGNTGVNSDGDANDLIVMVHSDASEVAAASGTPQFTGLIYAPGTDFVINGGGACGRTGGGPGCDGNIVGSIVAESADGGGNGKVVYDDSIDITLEFASASSITYLHVSENRVNVTES